MKSLLVSLLLMVIATSACAAVDLPPASLRDNPTPITRLYDIPPTFDPPISDKHCRIHLRDGYFGYLSNEEYSRKGKFPVGFLCLDATPPYKDISTVARFDSQKDKWVRNDAYRFYSPSDDPKQDLIWERRAAKSIHFYELNNVNSKGFAYTQDAITGDEDRRERILHYCLVKPPKALCGQGVMGGLNTIKKSDLTSYALKILRSIEFIEDALPENAATQPATDNK